MSKQPVIKWRGLKRNEVTSEDQKSTYILIDIYQLSRIPSRITCIAAAKRLVLIGVIGLVLSGLNPAVHEPETGCARSEFAGFSDPVNSAVARPKKPRFGLKLVREQRGSSP